jgi:hypothetical protein
MRLQIVLIMLLGWKMRKGLAPRVNGYAAAMLPSNMAALCNSDALKFDCFTEMWSGCGCRFEGENDAEVRIHGDGMAERGTGWNR